MVSIPGVCVRTRYMLYALVVQTRSPPPFLVLSYFNAILCFPFGASLRAYFSMEKPHVQDNHILPGMQAVWSDAGLTHSLSPVIRIPLRQTS